MVSGTGKLKVSIGMIFSGKEMELEVVGDEAVLIKRIEDTINDVSQKVLTIKDDTGKHVILPVDKIAYVDVHPDTAGAIGFH